MDERARACRALRDRSHQPDWRLTGDSIPWGKPARSQCCCNEALPKLFRSYKPPVKC